MGRPSKPENKKAKRIIFTASPEVWKMIKNKKNRSRFISDLIKNHHEKVA